MEKSTNWICFTVSVNLCWIWAKLVERLTWQPSKSMENFPSSCWLGNRRPLLKQCKTQQFGFHWTGLVVSTYITSIWKLKGNIETKPSYCTTWEQLLFQRFLFKWPRNLKVLFFFSEKLGFFPKDQQNQSNLWKLISNGTERRKSSLISFSKFRNSWNQFTKKSAKGPSRTKTKWAKENVFCTETWVVQ